MSLHGDDLLAADEGVNMIKVGDRRSHTENLLFQFIAESFFEARLLEAEPDPFHARVRSVNTGPHQEMRASSHSGEATELGERHWKSASA